MKKINKQSFVGKIQNILLGGIVPENSNNKVVEFKIGKKYFYKINNNNELVMVQKWFNGYFQEKVPLNNSAIAFRKNLSYLNLFEPHRKNYYFLRLDIKSFFHSVNTEDIKNIFKEYFEHDFIDEDKKQSLVDAFLNIITYKIPSDSENENFRDRKVLPIGFITSPVVSNIVFRKLDIQIQKFCSERNIIYTRYADDMLFSSNKDMSYIHSENFINEINIILSQMNFKLNKKKTIKSKHTISLNGYTIQYSKFEKGFMNIIPDEEHIIYEVRLSDKKLKIIKKFIYLIEKNLAAEIILKKLFNYQLPLNIPTNKIQEYCNHQLVNKLTGYRSYLLSIFVFNNKYSCCQKNTIDKYIKIIENLNKFIEKLSK